MMLPQTPVYGVPTGWTLASVDQIKSEERYSCVAGPFGSSISSKYFVDEGIPVIRGSNLRDDLTRFVPDGLVFVSVQQAGKYRPQHVRAGDLVFTCWGTIGQVGIIPETSNFDEYIISNKQLKLSVNKNVVDPLFCFYYFASPKYRDYVRGRNIGGAVPGINLGILKSLTIAFPELKVQQRIADAIGSYDDLIANNKRRIELLEQSARLLYREWFVRFKYPGHEHGKIVDGLPAGWKRKKVGELLAKIPNTKRIMKDSYLPQGTIPCIDQSREFIGGYTEDVDALFEKPLPVIVFGDHTRILKYVDFPFARGADGTQIIITNDPNLSPAFFYYSLDAIDLSNYFYARHFKFLKDQQIPVPPEPFIKAFESFARSNLDQVKLLRKLIARLASARDLLLPRLMNGRISV